MILRPHITFIFYSSLDAISENVSLVFLLLPGCYWIFVLMTVLLVWHVWVLIRFRPWRVSHNNMSNPTASSFPASPSCPLHPAASLSSSCFTASSFPHHQTSSLHPDAPLHPACPLHPTTPLPSSCFTAPSFSSASSCFTAIQLPQLSASSCLTAIQFVPCIQLPHCHPAAPLHLAIPVW